MNTEAYWNIKKTIPELVTLVAVSKTKSIDDILSVYNCGQRVFGENKVQELCQKQEQLPKDIHWHMVGHLQTNKVKYIAPFVTLIHGVDSLKLLKEINKQALQNKRTINYLLQIDIAREETKFGLSYTAAKQLLLSQELKVLNNINLMGLMGMATNTDDQNIVSGEFTRLHNFFDEMKKIVIENYPNFSVLSMGMSNDYQLAITCGSTMVRVGSSIFGSR